MSPRPTRSPSQERAEPPRTQPPCSLRCNKGDPMRFRINALSSLLLTIAAVSTAQAVAQAGPSADKALPAELALNYSYMRSNAPPGGCGCFNLNGASATVAWPVKPGKFAFVGDLTIANANKIDN